MGQCVQRIRHQSLPSALAWLRRLRRLLAIQPRLEASSASRACGCSAKPPTHARASIIVQSVESRDIRRLLPL